MLMARSVSQSGYWQSLLRLHPPHFDDFVAASGSCFDSHNWKMAQNAHSATTASNGKRYVVNMSA